MFSLLSPGRTTREVLKKTRSSNEYLIIGIYYEIPGEVDTRIELKTFRDIYSKETFDHPIPASFFRVSLTSIEGESEKVLTWEKCLISKVVPLALSMCKYCAGRKFKFPLNVAGLKPATGRNRYCHKV